MRLCVNSYWILISCLIFLSAPAIAQSSLTVRIGAPETDTYPQISAYLSVQDSQGQFVHNLQSENLTVVEQGNNLPVETLEALHPGVQVVIAINPGPAFAIRNFQAVSRFDLVKAALSDWVKSRAGTTTDDLSLLITGGQSISHVSDPAKWLSGLEADTVDPRTAQPSIDTLARAIALASDPTLRPGMGRAVLFITSSIDGNIEQAIQDLSNQARQNDITVHVWLVASSGALITRSAEQLSAISGATGGQVFNFSGEETLPTPEAFLDPERQIYRFSYQSRAGMSTENEFFVLVSLGEEQVQSNPLTFQVELLPPEPAFISPPILIERTETIQADGSHTSSPDDRPSSRDFLEPKEVGLQVVFDFPDGRKRELVSSTLIVDNQIAAENTSAPFDQFIWSLDPYLESGVHQIQVQVTDVLGLSGKSIVVPVEVAVEQLDADPSFILRKNLPAVSLILVVLAGSLLFLVLVLGGRLRPRSQHLAQSKLKADPLNHLHIEGEDSAVNSRQGWMSRRHHPNQPVVPDALAYFQRVEEGKSDPSGLPIPIFSAETTLGSDPTQATLVIDDPCIEPRHARLICSAQKEIMLVDLGTIAGTWVNYTPVGPGGTVLQNGDLVHFGRIGFRFTRREPDHVLKPSITINSPSSYVVQTHQIDNESEDPAL